MESIYEVIGMIAVPISSLGNEEEFTILIRLPALQTKIIWCGSYAGIEASDNLLALKVANGKNVYYEWKENVTVYQ